MWASLKHSGSLKTSSICFRLPESHFKNKIPVLLPERGVLPPHPRFWVCGAEPSAFHHNGVAWLCPRFGIFRRGRFHICPFHKQADMKSAPTIKCLANRRHSPRYHLYLRRTHRSAPPTQKRGARQDARSRQNSGCLKD